MKEAFSLVLLFVLCYRSDSWVPFYSMCYYIYDRSDELCCYCCFHVTIYVDYHFVSVHRAPLLVFKATSIPLCGQAII